MSIIIEQVVPKPFLDLYRDTVDTVVFFGNMRVSIVKIFIAKITPARVKKFFHIEDPVMILRGQCRKVALKMARTLVRVVLFVFSWIVGNIFGLMIGVGISALSLPASMVSVGGFFLGGGILEMVAARSLHDLGAGLFMISLGRLFMQNYEINSFGFLEYYLRDWDRIKSIWKTFKERSIQKSAL